MSRPYYDPDCEACGGTGREMVTCSKGEDYEIECSVCREIQPLDALLADPEEPASSPCSSGPNDSKPVMPDRWGGRKPHRKSWKHRFGVDR